MPLNSRIAQCARVATRRSPFLYKALKSLHHSYIGTRERRRLRINYGDIQFVEHDKEQLEVLKRKGFHAQFGQDHFLVSSRLVPLKGGVFLDIGCNDPVHGSSSYYFEECCGYSGVAVDPLETFSERWKAKRANTVFVQAFVSEIAGSIDFVQVDGDRGWESKLSGASQSVNLKGKNVRTTHRTVAPVRLDDLLDKHGLDFDVNILFVDVEGHELEVLRSVSWHDKKPGIIVIENTGRMDDQERLRAFILDKGYRLLARISIFDDIYSRSDLSPGVLGPMGSGGIRKPRKRFHSTG